MANQRPGSCHFLPRLEGNFDNVDVATGAISISVPVRTKNGKVPLVYSLFGNTFMDWGTSSWLPYSGLGFTFKLGNRTNPVSVEPTVHTKNQPCDGKDTDTVASGYVLKDSIGTQYKLPISFKTDGEGCIIPPAVTLVGGNSGVTVVTTTDPWTLYDSSGNGICKCGTRFPNHGPR